MAELIVDHREQAPDLLRALREDYGHDVCLRQLKMGDYRFGCGAVVTVVERKTVEDFCISLMQGRLFRQAYRLSSDCTHPVLLVEGASLGGDGMKVRAQALKGALVTLAQTFRLPVLRSHSQTDSAWYLDRLIRQRARVGDGAPPLQGYRPKRTATRKRYVLQALPGIGRKRAEALLRHFGSVAKVVAASERELIQVAGIGVKQAAAIREVLRETPLSYGDCAERLA